MHKLSLFCLIYGKKVKQTKKFWQKNSQKIFLKGTSLGI